MTAGWTIRLSSREAIVAEREIGEAMPVEGPVSADDFRPEVLDDGVIDGCPGDMSSRPTASASMMCAPRERKMAATVVFPLPNPPVRPDTQHADL